MADVDKKSHVLTCKRMRGVCLSISFQLGAREIEKDEPKLGRSDGGRE